MRPDVTRPSRPEERELAKKSAELAGLQVELAQRELDLATLRAELRDFERRYLHIVGSRYAELDEIEAQITEALAQLSPQDIVIQEKAVHTRAQASESAQALKIGANQAPVKDFTPSENLKKLYREVAKRVHPGDIVKSCGLGLIRQRPSPLSFLLSARLVLPEGHP